MISEAAQIRSASALLLFTPRRDLGDFDMGRLFYRRSLEIAALGAGMVPMSALADSPAARERLGREHGIPADRRLANVLRVGGVPPGGAARSPGAHQLLRHARRLVARIRADVHKRRLVLCPRRISKIQRFKDSKIQRRRAKKKGRPRGRPFSSKRSNAARNDQSLAALSLRNDATPCGFAGLST